MSHELKDLDRNVTRNPPLIIDHQIKCVKSFSWHSQIVWNNNPNGFNKGKQNMVFHSLVDHLKCRNPTLAKCGGEAQHFQSWGFGVLWDSRMFRVRQQGPKHLALRCSWCHWKKVLKRRYRKWPRIGHLDICSPSYGQKKGRESNWQFDSRPLKVGNWPLVDIRFEGAIRLWKDLNEGYKFGLDLVAIRLCSRELWAPKVLGLHPGQFRDNFGTLTWESREKEPLRCSLGGEAQRIL